MTDLEAWVEFHEYTWLQLAVTLGIGVNRLSRLRKGATATQDELRALFELTGVGAFR